jgi:hypothetical protein
LKLPGSLKFKVHWPAILKVTTPPLTVQTDGVAEVIMTGSPDVAVALGV